MGIFSWLDCVSGNAILAGRYTNVYLLVPAAFGGGHLSAPYYNGYGSIGGDVYEYVADWNRGWLSDHPEFFTAASGGVRISDYSWYCDYANLSLTKAEVLVRNRNLEWREIGICIARYDLDNSRLAYPLKITMDGSAIYEDCPYSLSDPYQGTCCLSAAEKQKMEAWRKSVNVAVKKSSLGKLPQPRKKYPLYS